MVGFKDVKNLTRKELIELIKDICLEHADELYLRRDIDFKFDHYDNDLKIVFLRETENTENPVTYDLLKDLSIDLKNINKRIEISIFYEKIPTGIN